MISPNTGDIASESDQLSDGLLNFSQHTGSDVASRRHHHRDDAPRFFRALVFFGLTCGSFAVSTDNAVAGAHRRRGFDPF